MENRMKAIATEGQWTIVLVEDVRGSYTDPAVDLKAGRLYTMGTCESCQGTGLKQDRTRGAKIGDQVECHCGARNFTPRFGYEVEIYAAKIARGWNAPRGTYEVKPATVNLGSIGSVSPTDARLRAKLLSLAADVAERYTLEARQWLLEHSAELAANAAAKEAKA